MMNSTDPNQKPGVNPGLAKGKQFLSSIRNSLSPNIPDHQILKMSNRTGDTSEVETAFLSCHIGLTQFVVFCVEICGLLLMFLSFFSWQLYCLPLIYIFW